MRVSASIFNPPSQKAQKTPQAFLFPSNTKKLQAEFMARRLGTASKGAAGSIRFKTGVDVEMPNLNPLSRMSTHSER